jgi:ABC-type sugar transport system ATPase subunit
VTALADLTLAVRAGECLTLVGPSGCGKTTLLRLGAGLDQPTSGSISLGGRSAADLPPHRRGVAYLAQRPALYPHWTVDRNLRFGSATPPGSGPAARAVDLLGLADLLSRLPHQLSGGQRQRVALGRAIVRAAEVWLLDEPLASLDLPSRLELRRQLDLLRREFAATMIYVTHDAGEAVALADRVAVLNGGRLQQVGPWDELVERPANRFVAGFLGSPPMNLLDGTFVRHDGRPGFRVGERTLALKAGPGLPPAEGRWTLGLRPEGLRLAGGEEPAESFRFVRREWFGGGWFWEVGDGLRLLAGPLGDPPPEVGHAVRLALDFDRIHWFDAATGEALAPRPASG